MPKYSIVIPTMNHLEDCLIPCIESIKQHTELSDVEVIIVANGCTDGTSKYIESLGEPFRMLWLEEASGFTHSTNVGIRVAKGRYVIILNNDLQLLSSEWLGMLEKPFLEDDLVGITGAAKNYHEPTEHDFLLFFCVCVRKDMFHKFGPLDEIFNPGYGEDIDFCFRVRNGGFKVVQVPNDVNLSKLRNPDEHTLQFPIWHKSSQTVHSVPGWKEIVARNENILQQRYGKNSSVIDIGNLLDTVPSSELTKTIDGITAKLGGNGVVTATLNDRTKLTLARTGFIHGVFPGEENMYLLKEEPKMIEMSLEGIKEHVLSCGSKTIHQFGGRWEGGYATQQDPDEISEFLYDYHDKKINNYLEIGAAEGGVTRLLCDVLMVGNVYHIDLGWGDMNHPYTYRKGIENLRNAGKIEILRGDSTSKDAENFLKDKKFDMIFIDGDHSYEGVKKDTELAMKHAEDGCLFIYHDHVAVEDVGKFHNDLKNKKYGRLFHEKDYVSNNPTKKGISIFKYLKQYAGYNGYKDAPKEHKKVSIIIPTYNHLEDALKPCIESIEKYTSFDEVEVIVVANGCTDDTLNYCNSKDYIQSIWMDEAVGFIKAINAGIKVARGEFVVLLNNDTVLQPQEKDEWLKMLSIPFMDEKVGITGPYKDWRFFWESGKLIFREEYMVFYSVMIRKKVFDEIGVLDEDFGLGYEEDVDFAIRARNAGWKIVQVPEDIKDELSVTKDFLVNYKGRTGEFPLMHKDKVTFSEVKENTGKKTSLLEKHLKRPKYSIIIPTYNHLEDLLHPCLQSVAKYTNLDEVEVIVVANGCTDRTRDYVNTLGKPFKLYWMEEQAGFIKATNAGIKQAMGDYIVFLNNDVQITGYGWLDVLSNSLQGERAGIAGPVKAFRDDVKRNYILFWSAMIKQEVFDKIGVLDEAFGIGYHEDVDFCIRAEDAGFELVETPPFQIFHQGGGTFAPIFGQSEERLQKHVNVLYDKLKNEPGLPGGWFGIDDQNFYKSLVENVPQDGQIAEIGTWEGRSLCSLAEVIKRKNLRVVAVDTFQGSPSEEVHKELMTQVDVRGEFERGIERFEIKDHITLFPIPSVEAAKLVTNESLDFIFIDAEHTYESTKADILAWLPKLKSTGIIAGHDILWSENVGKAVHEIFGDKVYSGENIWYVMPENRRKVYDCFTFFNELDILEIRLNELNEVVDKFVLVEAKWTHQGKPKPFYFEENKQRFAKFLDKIIHIKVDEMPDGNWEREHYQRNAITKALTNCNDSDIIIISDADEILNPKVVQNYKISDGVCAVEMALFYFKLDWMLDEKWYKPRILPYSKFKEHGAQYFRGEGDYIYKTIIPDGGWHYSFLGDKKSVKEKIQAYAHEEFNNDSFTNDKNIEEAIEQGRDVFRRNLHFNKVTPDYWWPEYVKNNLHYYEEKGLLTKLVLSDKFVDYSISDAKQNISKINKEVLSLEGMSNDKIRHLFNNILSFGNLNYLEVGCWRGATASAALSNNKLSTATIIDNFSEFAVPNKEQEKDFIHPRDELVTNLGNFSSGNPVKVIEEDFFKFDVSTLPKIDVFFYDGVHSGDSHYRSLVHALPALADVFIYIVDDYSWPIVNKPVQECLKHLIATGEIKCLYEKTLESELPPAEIWPDGWNHLYTHLSGEWRNGIYVGLFKKNKEEIRNPHYDKRGKLDGGEIYRGDVYRGHIDPSGEDGAPGIIGRNHKVYDCFSFFNELDLLEIRLEELDPYVDKFVLSEMRQTHSGLPKSLYYEQNKSRFKKFWHKIVHVIAPDIETPDPWVREHHQRDYMIEYLKTVCKDQDLIIVSDLDEIPRGTKVNQYFGYDGPGMRFFEQNQYSYYLNYNVGISPISPGTFSRILPYQTLKLLNLSLTGVRYKPLDDRFKIEDGGWHFSWMGGGKKISEKLKSWAHQEFNKPELTNEGIIDSYINSGKEHLGRQGVGETTPVDIDNTFPQYIQDHKKELTEKGLIKVDKRKVAIIMPYFNDKNNITKSVGAILGQTFTNWELFISDDGSDKDKKARNILANHPKILIWDKKNEGPSSARNESLGRITMKHGGVHNNWWSELHPGITHIAFCDSDDIWDPNYLSSQLKNIGDADIIYCSVNHSFENGDPAIAWGIPDPEEYPGREFMLKTPFIYISGVLCTRKFLSLGEFDSKLDSIEDWDMWLRADEEGFKFKHNKDKLMTYTVKSGMAGQRTEEKLKLLKEKHGELVI